MKMNPIKKVVLTVLSFVSIVYTVISMFDFTRFLSDFSPKVNYKLLTDPSLIIPKDVSQDEYFIVEALVIDLSLLCIFIIVHSSLIPLQEIFSTVLKMPVLNKTFYSLLTSASLQLLVHMWIPIPQYTLWAIDVQEATRLRAFLAVHVASWILIYVMMITVDVTDLLGVKQVYYHVTGRPMSSSVKSEQLKHLHKKMRHPSFLGFAIIFWIYPSMRFGASMIVYASTVKTFPDESRTILFVALPATNIQDWTGYCWHRCGAFICCLLGGLIHSAITIWCNKILLRGPFCKVSLICLI